MKWMLPLFAAALALSCVSCATQAKTMPDAADLESSRQRFRAQAQPQFDELERQRASGAISKEDYEREKSALEYRVHQRAVDAAWTAHALAESERKANGIPTPDSPQAIDVGGVTGSLYQSSRDAYGSQGGAGVMGQSYQPGSSIIGRSGQRSF